MSNQPARSSLLRVGSYNIMDGGEDRWAGQMDLLASLDLDVLGVQEAKHWERHDHARLHTTAAALEMQALFAPSKSHGCHLVLFYRWPRVNCARFQPDISGGRFHHTASRALLEVDGLALQVLHTHLHPFAPSARLKEAGWLTEYAADDGLSLLIGDLNTSGLGDPDPADWEQVAAHLHSRHRQMLADGSYGGTDRRAMHALMNAGFVDPRGTSDGLRHVRLATGATKRSGTAGRTTCLCPPVWPRRSTTTWWWTPPLPGPRRPPPRGHHFQPHPPEPMKTFTTLHKGADTRA